ncbi:VWA domain-containing protein [Candidatus Entotheonella palauensis]|nr:VWA domain-containing protein [Candidatus Entotheonella palauensis]
MHVAAWPYLYLLGLVPALLALYLYAFRRKRQALAVFSGPELASRLLPGFSRTRRWVKTCCVLSAVGCLVLSLTQPQWGIDWQQVPRRGRDLIIMLDVSLSMMAEDVEPNRLERAKQSILPLIERLRQEGGHRLGLVAFAGRASLQCPLTLDYAFFLQRLREAGPETVTREGTLIGDAIEHMLSAFGTLEPEYTDIILITDGEDHNSLPLAAARIASLQQVSLYTVGVGDASRGALIPLPEATEDHTYVQYRGQAVRSRMQQSLLLEMAQLTGGAYVPAGTRDIELDRLYQDKIASKVRRDIDVDAREGLVHRYYWFVLAALMLLAIDMLVRERNLSSEGGAG